MEWSEKDTLRLIQEIRRREIIWDPTHPHRKSKQRKKNALDAVAASFPPCTQGDVLHKWRNLCQIYRICRRKIENFKKSGTGTADDYIPSWFAFTSMNEIMNAIYTPLTITDAPKKLQKKDTVKQAETVNAARRYSKKPDAVNQAESLNMVCRYSETKSIDTPALPDECSLYGALIAQQLRQMDDLTRKHTMHDINNVIFKNSISPISSGSELNSAQNYQPPSQICPSPPSRNSTSPLSQTYFSSLPKVSPAHSPPHSQT